jgi:hypothetical protein
MNITLPEPQYTIPALGHVGVRRFVAFGICLLNRIQQGWIDCRIAVPEVPIPLDDDSGLRQQRTVECSAMQLELDRSEIPAHLLKFFEPAPMPKPKDALGIPWRVAFALQEDGWWLRSDIIWAKPNPMPESVTDRPTKSHEYIFLLTKAERYYYDAEAIAEVGAQRENFGNSGYKGDNNEGRNDNGRRDMTPRATRNRRSVWTVATSPYPGAHFATYPPKLVEPCILAGSSARGRCPVCGAPWERETEVSYSPTEKTRGKPGSGTFQERGAGQKSGGWNDYPSLSKHTETLGWRPTCSHDAEPVPCLILDPFCGSGTTGAVAVEQGRDFVGLELNPEYIALAMERLQVQPRLMGDV